MFTAWLMVEKDNSLEILIGENSNEKKIGITKEFKLLKKIRERIAAQSKVTKCGRYRKKAFPN